jgi:hypothetical protein
MPLSKKFRLDFKVIEGRIDDSGAFSFLLVPDPARYERLTENGQTFWYDRYDQLLIPENEVEKAAKQMANLPIFYTPPEISKENLDAYLRDSRVRIEKRVREGTDFVVRGDESEAFCAWVIFSFTFADVNSPLGLIVALVILAPLYFHIARF